MIKPPSGKEPSQQTNSGTDNRLRSLASWLSMRQGISMTALNRLLGLS